MWGYTYKHGDRPLEGFTIQRAAGRGGFGEVYYALSDGGREVALKVVTGYAQVELRGIGQCMNLKSPYLVTIFDVKYNHEGRPFVIMEYVSGPSLRQMLDESPAGLGVQKTAFFLREIGKGLTYLHDCGIVHRDLKPANIFFEGGYAKIGDYGLSKAISASPDSGQTMTVGTVHYMAPEIGAGKYDRSIDIYAMGCMLYELITGTVPFVGASPSEVLMKHLSGEPDVSGVPEPFATVIKKAMAKRPEDRYQSVQEMVEAVFGAEHIRESVSVFSPADLSVAAAKVAAKVGGGAGGGGVGGGSKATPPPVPPPLGGARADSPGARPGETAGATDAWGRLAGILDDAQQNASEKIRGFGLWADDDGPTKDALSLRQRRMLAGALLVLVVIISTAAFGEGKKVHPAVLAMFSMICVAGATMGIGFGGRVFLHKLRKESDFHRKLVGGLCALVVMGIPAGGIVLGIPALGPLFVALAGTFFIVDVAEWLRPDRKDRVVVARLITAGIAALILGAVFDSSFTMVGVLCAAGVAAAVQLLTPWDQAAGAERAAKDERQAARERAANAAGAVGGGGAGAANVGAVNAGAANVGAAGPGAAEFGAAAGQQAARPKSFEFDLKFDMRAENAKALERLRRRYWHIPTPAGLKIAFLSLMGLFLAISGVCFYSMLETKSDVLPAPFFLLTSSEERQGRMTTVILDDARGEASGAANSAVAWADGQMSGKAMGVAVNGLEVREQVLQAVEASQQKAMAIAEKAMAERQAAAERASAAEQAPARSVTGVPAAPAMVETTTAVGDQEAQGPVDPFSGMAWERKEARRLGGMSVAFGAMAVWFFRRSREAYYFGVWPSIVRPVVIGVGLSLLIGVGVSKNVLQDPDGIKNMLPALIPVGSILAVSWPIHGRRRWEDVPVPVTEASVHSRDIALALTALWLLGIGGAHRLYAGKVWTGVLWLLTFGLLGIGQLVDVILLASNQFRDGQGRQMLPKGMQVARAMPPRPPQPPTPEERGRAAVDGENEQGLEGIGQQVEQFAQTVAVGVTAAAQSVDEALRARWAGESGGAHGTSMGTAGSGGAKFGGSGWGATVRTHVLSGIASLLLLISVVLTIGLAVDLPGALAARVGPLGEISLPAELRAVENWPYVLRKLGQAGLSITLLGAALCIMTARVGGDMMHLYRGLLGMALMGGFVLAAGYVFPAEQIWAAAANTAATSQPVVLVERFVRGFSLPAATTAGLLLLVALLILSWPARRWEPGSGAPGNDGGGRRADAGTRQDAVKTPPPTF